MNADNELVVREGQQVARKFADFKVKNMKDVGYGCEALVTIKAGIARVDEVLGPVKAKAYAAYQEASGLYNSAREQLDAADGHIRTEINEHLSDLKNKPEDMPDGVTVSDKWAALECDVMALAKAVVEGKAPAFLLKVDTTALNKLVTANKGFTEIPGVKVEKFRTVKIKG